MSKISRVGKIVLGAVVASLLLSAAAPVEATQSPTKAKQPSVHKQVKVQMLEGIQPTVNTKKNGKAEITSVGPSEDKTVTLSSEVVVGGIKYTVTRISAGVFAECAQMKKLELPDTIEEIGEGAFTGALLLKRIEFTGEKAPKISKKAFEGIDTKEMVITYAKEMTPEEIKKFKRRLRKAGFEGKIKVTKKDS